MNTEKLILKGVETKLIGGRTFFKVESLNEHFDRLLIHESDWVQVEDEAYVVLSDVNLDNATDNEIQRKSEVAEEEPYELSEEGTVGIVSTLSPEEADALIKEANKDFIWDENAEIEVIEPEVVEPEIVAPEVIVAETPKKKSKK